MIKEIQISLLPEQVFIEEELLSSVSLFLKLKKERINHIEIILIFVRCSPNKKGAAIITHNGTENSKAKS